MCSMQACLARRLHPKHWHSDSCRKRVPLSMDLWVGSSIRDSPPLLPHLARFTEVTSSVRRAPLLPRRACISALQLPAMCERVASLCREASRQIADSRSGGNSQRREGPASSCSWVYVDSLLRASRLSLCEKEEEMGLVWGAFINNGVEGAHRCLSCCRLLHAWKSRANAQSRLVDWERETDINHA